jgi:hypothetical protein
MTTATIKKKETAAQRRKRIQRKVEFHLNPPDYLKENFIPYIRNFEFIQKEFKKLPNLFEMNILGKKVKVMSNGELVYAKKAYAKHWTQFEKRFLKNSPAVQEFLSYLFGTVEDNFELAFQSLQDQFIPNTAENSSDFIYTDKKEDSGILIMSVGDNEYLYQIFDWHGIEETDTPVYGNAYQVKKDLNESLGFSFEEDEE